MGAKSWLAAAASAVVGGVLTIGAASAQPVPPDCTFCTAMVNGDGSVARRFGVTGVTRLGEGVYDVRFAASVGKCFWIATLADPGQGDATPGMVAVSGRGRVRNGLYLKTFAPGGQPADHGFSVTTICEGPPSCSRATVGGRRAAC